MLDEIDSVEGVTASTPAIYKEVMLNSGYSRGSLLRGIDPEKTTDVIDIEPMISQGDLQSLNRVKDGIPSIIVGSELAKQLRVIPGDIIKVFSPDGKLTPMGRVQSSRNFRVSALFNSGMYDYDLRTIYLPLADAQRYLGKPGTITSISVRLDSYDNAPQVRAMLLGILTPDELARGVDLLRPLLGQDGRDEIARLKSEVAALRHQAPTWFAEGDTQAPLVSIDIYRGIRELAEPVLSQVQSATTPTPELERFIAFTKTAIQRYESSIGPKFRISTWEDKRRTFLRALWLERRIITIILFFVILIAGFLILSILHTTVITKTKDIGILKSIGGSVGGIMSIFLLNGLFIGILGSALGTVAGLLITKNINAIEDFLHRLIGFRLFPSNIYYLDRVPVIEDPFWSIICICLVSIAISFGASAYPAWKASRMNPVEALRYE